MQLLKEEAINLKPNRDGYMGRFEERKGKEDMFNSNATLETNKIPRKKNDTVTS